MANRPEYTLNYHFDFRNSKDLKTGEYLASSVPATNNSLFGQSVITSPAGFPIPLSLHLLHRKSVIESEDFHCSSLSGSRNRLAMDIFLLQLRLHLPAHVSFLPPLTIQPIRLPTDREYSLI